MNRSLHASVDAVNALVARHDGYEALAVLCTVLAVLLTERIPPAEWEVALAVVNRTVRRCMREAAEERGL